MNNNTPRFSGKIYPDKSFSLGIVPKKKKRLEDEHYDKDTGEIYDSYQLVKRVCGRKVKVDYEFLKGTAVPNRLVKGQESSRKPRRYGSHGITGYGKKNVRCIGVILQRRYRKCRLGFGTCTIPPFSDIILGIIAGEWSEITRRFFQKLRRHCEKKGKKFIYYGVTEIQSERYKSTGIPVPHLHFGYVCRDSKKGDFYFTPTTVRKFWRQAIGESLVRCSISFRGEKVSYLASVDLQVVRKSVGAYMSKYLSKGCDVVDDMIERGFTKWLPKQWWFACMQCKKWFKESIIRMSQELCASFFYDLESYLHQWKITWCNYVDVQITPDRSVVLGLVGKLDWKLYGRLKDEYGIK